ncbi:TPA: hypothetical protein ACK3RV_007319, partial [Burkholderia cepacia]
RATLKGLSSGKALFLFRLPFPCSRHGPATGALAQPRRTFALRAAQMKTAAILAAVDQSPARAGKLQ